MPKRCKTRSVGFGRTLPHWKVSLIQQLKPLGNVLLTRSRTWRTL